MNPDDGELLAIFDAAGRRLGAKSRAAVHREHDWHWLVFVWAAYLDPQSRARMVLQVRARPGDPHLGSLDAPAGGHVIEAETHLQGAVREFGEEVGVELGCEDLVYLGVKALENPGGICRRVFQHFYLCVRPIDLRAVKFNREVSGFVEVGLEEFAELLHGRRDRVDACGRFAAREDEIESVQITQESLASYSDAIMNSFRRSVEAIRIYLHENRIDAALWY